MGNTAEAVANQFKVSREDQDEFAITSYKRAADAWANGRFNDEVVSVEVPQRRGDAIIVNENSSGLLYEVYISSSNNLTSIETIRLNGEIVVSGKSINFATATALDPDTIYYLNVIVTLQSENIEIKREHLHF